MKIIENNYTPRRCLNLNKQNRTTVSNAEFREQPLVNEFSPIYYNYLPNINFEGSSQAMMKLTNANLGNTFRDKMVVDTVTNLAGRLGKDFAGVQAELTQMLTPVLQTQDLKIVRDGFPKFCESLYQGLNPLIASYLIRLGMDNDSRILAYFNQNNTVDYTKWDIDTLGIFTAYGLDFDKDYRRFDELKSNPDFSDSLIPWAIKWGLSDEQIQTFIQEKQNNYDILEEELLFCVANDLTSVPIMNFPRGQIGRYEELRKREYNYLHEHTVRGQGGEHNYPVYIAMKYAKGSLTDDEINAIERVKDTRRYELQINNPWLMFYKFTIPPKIKSSVDYLSFFDLLEKGEKMALPKQKIKTLVDDSLNIVRLNSRKRLVLPNLDKWGVDHPFMQPQKGINEMFERGLTLNDFQSKPVPFPKMLDVSKLFKRDARKPMSYYSFAKEELQLLNSLKYLKGFPVLKESLPMDIWYNAQTNTDEKTFKVLKKTAEDFLGATKGNVTIQGAYDVKSVIRGISSLDDRAVVYASNKLNYDSRTSILKFNDGNNGFEVQVVPIMVENEKALLFLDDDKGYLAYKGAISEVKAPYSTNEVTKASLRKYANIYSIKQIQVLLDAIKFLPMNLINADGTVMIGQGLSNIPPYKGAKHNTYDTKSHYGNLFANLRNQGGLSVVNILKIMPIDANISINPCITDGGNILYSVSSEWQDSQGAKWQLRAHSTDLGYSNGGNNWVARCAYRVSDNDKPEYLYEDNGTISGVFKKEIEPGVTGGVSLEQSHIKVDSPIEDVDNLLNNVYFQDIVHQISLNVEQAILLKRLTKSMGLIYQNVEKRDVANILQKLYDAPELYAYNKADIDKLRKTYGYLTCN